MTEYTPLINEKFSSCFTSGTDVLEALKRTDEQHVIWALKRLLQERPHLLRNDPAGFRNPSTSFSHSAENRSIRLEQTEATDELLSTASPNAIAQFATPVAYKHESEGSLALRVIRSGDLASTTQVKFRTVDGSAKAGTHYESTHGIVNFASNEFSKVIRIPILDDGKFGMATTSFLAELYDVHGATLPTDKKTAVGVIIEDTPFPSGHCEINSPWHELASLEKCKIFREYILLTLQNPIIRRRFIKSFMIDQLHSLCALLQMLVRVYLVDMVLETTTPQENLWVVQDRQLSLLFIVLVLIGPFALLHVVDFWRVCYCGLGGRPRFALQQNLMRKFSHYDVSLREQLGVGKTVQAICVDAPLIVSHGFQDAAKIGKSLGDIFAIVSFNVVASVAFGKKAAPMLYAAIGVFPLCFVCVLALRSYSITEHIHERNLKFDMLHEFASEFVQNIEFLSDYDQRGRYHGKFEQHILDFNRANNRSGRVLLNTYYLMKWLVVLLSAAYTVKGGLDVLHGEASLGMFLANLAIIEKLGKSWGRTYKILINIITIFPSMGRVRNLMNLDSDFSHAESVLKHRDLRTIELLNDQIIAGRVPSLDLLPITVQGLSSEQIVNAGGFSSTLNLSGQIEIQQGSLVCFMGGHNCGKGILLRAISRRFASYVEADKVFVPVHLRTLLVSSDPCFFAGTLLSNLELGAAKTQGVKLEHVLRICKRLNLSQEICKMIESDSTMVHWASCLSKSQSNLLCLARALISNPDVLILDKLGSHFNLETFETVMDVLHEFVIARGVQQSGDVALRQVKTSIFSCSRPFPKAELVTKAFFVHDGVRERDLCMLERESFQASHVQEAQNDDP